MKKEEEEVIEHEDGMQGQGQGQGQDAIHHAIAAAISRHTVPHVSVAVFLCVSVCGTKP